MVSRLVPIALLAGALGFSTVALADPSAADKETARSLMNEGRAARDRGDLKGALKSFSGADAIMHVPTTGLEVAKTQAALGLLVEARDTALRVSRIPEKPGEPGPFKQARDAASTLNDDVESRIPSLTVNVKNVPDGMTATVTLDDTTLPAELLGEPRKLDPGHHVVVAKAGKVDGKQEVDVAEKEQKRVTIELPAQPAPETTTTETPPAQETPPPAAPTKSGFSKGLMIGGFALGGAGLVSGVITGVLSMSKTSSIKSSPACAGNSCGPPEYNDISSAKSMATISTISFIVAGAGAALGVVGLVTGNSTEAAPASAPPDKDKPASEETTSRIEPWLGLGAAGLRGTF